MPEPRRRVRKTAKKPSAKRVAKKAAKRSVKKAPAKRVVKKSPAKRVVKKSPAKKVAKKSPAKKVAVKSAPRVTPSAPHSEATAHRLDPADLEFDIGALRDRVVRPWQPTAMRLPLDNIADRLRDLPHRDLLDQLRPSDPFGHLDDDLPLLLLPIQVETKFVLDDGPPVLRIRIYPDQTHVHGDSPEPTEAEIEAAVEFWEKWLGTKRRVDRRAAFGELARALGQGRAGHVARLLRPKETSRGLEFPKVEPRKEPERSSPVLLPSRWRAIGYQYGQVLFDAESNPIDPTLTTGINPDDNSFVVGDSGLAIDPEVAWMFDYDRAVDQGMAITVPLADLPQFATPENGTITTLFVIGVRDASDPEAEASQLAELLEMHERSTGAAFVPQGTPTNNTAFVESGWTRTERENAELAEREIDGVKGSSGDNADLLASAFGLTSPDSLRRLSHGDDRERQHVKSMNSVLFETVWGTYLRNLLSRDDLAFPPATITALRIWFIQQVTGGAPLPSLRIGEQPYGVLPVRVPGDGGTATRFENVERIVDHLKWQWHHSVPRVPTLDPNDIDIGGVGDPDQQIPAVLSSHPNPARLFTRRFYDDDDDFWSSLSPNKLYSAALQVMPQVHEQLFMLAFTTPTGGWESIDEQAAWWEAMHDVVDDDQYMSNSEKADAHDVIDGLLVSLEASERRQRPLRDLDVPTFEGILGRDQTNLLMGRFVSEVHEWLPEHLIELPDAPEGQRSADYLAEFATRVDMGAASVIQWDDRPPMLFQLIDKSFELTKVLPNAKHHFNTLAGLEPQTLDLLMRQTIGLGTHRLDAWMTSLASSHLNAMRTERPTGIQIGAFGWVRNLSPSAGRASNGFLHAPSLAHATTGAVLRSAWHAHGTDAATSSAAVNANSKRIRQAQWILDGVRNGQGLGELLGYRFERSLHDHPRRLDDQIRDIRLLVIGLADDTDATEDEPVDGLALLDAWRDGQLDSYLDGLASNDLKEPMEGELRQLERTFDAVSDVGLFESTHQLIQGNLDRARAVNESINLGTQAPPELRAPRTQRDGTSIEHRLLLLLNPDAKPAATGWSRGLRDVIAPAVEAWLREILPAPSEVGLSAIGLDRHDDVLGLTLDDLGLSALDAVFLSSPDPTRLTTSLAQLLRARHELPDDVELRPDERLDRPWSVEEFQLLAGELRAVLDVGRAADGRDMRPGYDAGEAGLDLSSVVGAVDEVWKKFAEAVGRGSSIPDPDTVRRFGVAVTGRPDQSGALIERARAARAENGGPTLEGQRRRAATLFGGAVPIMPTFTWSAGPSGGALTFDDQLAADSERLEWLEAVGSVRGDVGRLTAADLLADIGGSGRLRVQIGQDRVEQGDRWAALEAPTPESGGRTCAAAVVSSDPPAPGKRACGLMIDQWSERIPRSDQVTGVAFHYDAPSNKPAQAWILAMPPEGVGWSVEAVTSSLFHALGWAEFRMVAPEDLGDYGQAIPTAYANGVLSKFPAAEVDG